MNMSENNEAKTEEIKADDKINENITENLSAVNSSVSEKASKPKTDYSKSYSSDYSSENSRPIIQKRGGIGLLTATFLSTVAALGGAYLALFVQARPDVVNTLKIGAFLPKPANLADLDTLQKEIAQLQHDVTKIGNNQQAPFVTASQNPTDAAASANPAAPAANGDAAQNPATPNAATPSNNAPVPLQNTQPNPQQVQAAAQTITLEPIRADIAGLSGRLTAIETRLAALDPTGTGGAIIAALQTEIATLKVTVQDLQLKIAQTPSPATTFAVISIAEAANRNGSFVPEFEALRGALPFLPEVTALEPYAKTGAPTRALLREEFDTMAADVANNLSKPKEEKGFFGFFKNLFNNAFKVEVKDKNNPDKPDDIIARAKTRLDLDDLQGAVAELGKLQNPPASVATWIENAQKRQDLEVKISALRAAIERNMYSQVQNVAPQLNATQLNPAIGAVAPQIAQPNPQLNQQVTQPVNPQANQQANQPANQSANPAAAAKGENGK